MYLIDTNVLIRGLRGEDPEKSFLGKVISRGQIYLSTISVSEYLVASSEEEEIKLEKLIKQFPVLVVDLEVARIAASYRKHFLKNRRIQLLDYFLAAQARQNNLTLVTNNTSDFPMRDIKVIKPKR